MIRVSDALILAGTKLRVRRIRTVVTLVISGLLFSLLVAALLTTRGALLSIRRFSGVGLGNRYIVQAQGDSAIAGLTSNKEIIARAQQLYTQQVASKKVAAQKLGIAYDPAMDKGPTITFAGQSAQFLDITNPNSQQAIDEYLQAHPSPALPELRSVASAFHPIGFYSSEYIQPRQGTIATMQDGVENFSPDTTTSQNSDLLKKSQLQLTPAALTQPFMLSGAETKSGALAASAIREDAIPIVISYSDATQLLGLPALSAGATANQKLQRLAELYQKASSVSFSACYRNAVSEEQIQDAVTAAADIAKNTGNKQYQEPELVYGLPAANSCAAAPIVRDVRTSAEKTAAGNQKRFDAMFGTITDPVQRKLQFRVVGLMPDPQTGAAANSTAGILQNLVGSSLAGGIAIPQELYEQLPSAPQYDALLRSAQDPLFASPIWYAEFATAQDARAFIEQKSCTTREDGLCAAPGKPFQLSAFGSNSIALRDLQNKAVRIFAVATIVVTATAIVIMAAMVGRTITDGRRETAVFRAIGADRADIVLVYGSYTAMISLVIAVLALATGIGLAAGIDHVYRETLTAQAQLAFGGSHAKLVFRVFGWDARVWLVTAIAIVAGLFSMIVPLLRNIRRSPINDMREE